MIPKHPITSAIRRCADKGAIRTLLLIAFGCLPASIAAEPIKVFLLAGDEHVLEHGLIGAEADAGSAPAPPFPRPPVRPYGCSRSLPSKANS